MERNRGGRPRHPDILTPAEWRVLEELRKGGTNAEIAVRLGVSPDAVKYHISNMLGKLRLEDRHALATWHSDRERRRWLRLAIPAGLAAVGRPLLWGGAALAAVAVVVVVATLLIAVLGGGKEGEISSHVATTEPAPPTTPTPHLVPDTGPIVDVFTIDTGATDSLTLRWAGGPENAVGWQYRAARLQWFGNIQGSSEAGEWIIIPDSGGPMGTHQITGLAAGADYEIALRAVVEGGVGESVYVYDHVRHPDEAPYLGPTNLGSKKVAVGDGRLQWRVYDADPSWPLFLVTIPDQMWVSVTYDARPPTEVYVTDVHSSSTLVLSPEGNELRREVRGGGSGNVEALFDQIAASIMPVLKLRVVSDGTPGVLDLEWDGGPTNATRWQYRSQISHHPSFWEWGDSPERTVVRPWNEWRDIPDSGPDTRQHRLTNLRQGHVYVIRVRALVDDIPTYATGKRGFVQPENDLPTLFPGTLAEGDGSTHWRIGGTDAVIVIPAGKRVLLGWWNLTSVVPPANVSTARLYDPETYSEIGFWYNTKEGSGRFSEYPNVPGGLDERHAEELRSLWDQIKASLKKVPLPDR